MIASTPRIVRKRANRIRAIESGVLQVNRLSRDHVASNREDNCHCSGPLFPMSAAHLRSRRLPSLDSSASPRSAKGLVHDHYLLGRGKVPRPVLNYLQSHLNQLEATAAPFGALSPTRPYARP